MRFLFVVSGANCPATRFRILPYISCLESAGHRCDLAYSFPEKYEYFPSIGWRLSQRLKRTVRHYHAFLARCRKYDAIVIEREVFDDDTSNLEEKFRKHTQRLVLDVDDGIFLRHPEKFDRIARLCDVAIGGNRYLVDYLETRCSDVHHIPTCVKLAEYPKRAAQQQTTPTIGWIGTTDNVAFLSEAAEALRWLAERERYRLLIVAPSDKRLADIDLAGVDVQFRHWDAASEVQQIREMDIGLMPLPDGQEWMKYKCALKLIQYLAVGIPGVASPIGVNEEILRDGSVGRSASNPEQWKSALAELMHDSDLRTTLGNAGRELVDRVYSIEANWQHFERILTGQSS